MAILIRKILYGNWKGREVAHFEVLLEASTIVLKQLKMDDNCFPKRSVSVSQARYSGLLFIQSANATCSNEFMLPISPLVPFCVSTKETILWKAVDNKSKTFRFLEQNTKGTKLKGHRRGNFSTVIQHSSWRFAYENIVLKNIFFYLSKGQFRVRVQLLSTDGMHFTGLSLKSWSTHVDSPGFRDLRVAEWNVLSWAISVTHDFLTSLLLGECEFSPEEIFEASYSLLRWGVFPTGI